MSIDCDGLGIVHIVNLLCPSAHIDPSVILGIICFSYVSTLSCVINVIGSKFYTHYAVGRYINCSNFVPRKEIEQKSATISCIDEKKTCCGLCAAGNL